MSERIHLWLDGWITIAASFPSRSFSRNVGFWNNYNRKIICITRSYSRRFEAILYNLRINSTRHRSDVPRWRKDGRLLIDLPYTNTHIPISSSISSRLEVVPISISLQWYPFLRSTKPRFCWNSIRGDRKDNGDAHDGRMIEPAQKSFLWIRARN